MPSNLANPSSLVAICLVAVLVIGVNLTLLTVLRRNARGESDAKKWLQAFEGGRAGQRQQNAKLEELHHAVSQLPRAPTSSESPRE